MSNTTEDFVRLGRTFHALAKSAPVDDDIELTRSYFVGPELSWRHLLESYRVVILSEAGTGKTWEIRQAALDLRAEGKKAFFLRLEEIADNLDGAFESRHGRGI